MAYTYQNIGQVTLDIINVGVVDPGSTIESDERLHHPDLKQVPGEKKASDKETDVNG